MTTYIYDNDLSYPESLEDLCSFLEQLTECQLALTYWKTDGPGGGNPNFTITGKKENLIKWFSTYYQPGIKNMPAEVIWAEMSCEEIAA